MKCLILIASLFCVTPAVAQENSEEPSLMERGAQLLLEGLLQGMEPALDELQGLTEEIGPSLREFVVQMGPTLRELLDEVEDWSVYEPPEILENGDIIIRRKPPSDTPQPDANRQIEL